MIERKKLDSAVRSAFKSSLLNRMISDDLESLHGNSNGTTFAYDKNGKSVCLDDSGVLVSEGVTLLEAMLGTTTSKNSLIEMDVSVDGIVYCLSMTGPPTSDAPSWSVLLRENVASHARREIATEVNLKKNMTTRTLPTGVELVKSDLIPRDNPDHGGEQAVNLRTASGAEAWGFGTTTDDAVSDALAALANDL